MKKISVLLLLPLAVALFIAFPSTLSAGGKKDKKGFDAAVLTVPSNIGGDTAPASAIPGENLAPVPDKVVVTSSSVAAPSPIPGEVVLPKPDNVVISEPIPSAVPVATAQSTIVGPTQSSGASNDTWAPGYTPQIPRWITDPDPDRPDYEFVGVGSAYSSTDRLSIQMADARARQDIALQLSSNVKAMITDFAENQGSGVDEFNLLQASRNQMVGKQLSELELKDVKVTQRARANDGTWWVKVVYIDPAKKAAADRAKAAAERAATAAAAQATAAAGTTGGPVILPPIKVEFPAPGTDYTERAKEAIELMDHELEKVNAQRLEKTKAQPPAEEAKAQPLAEPKVQPPEEAKDQLSEKSKLKSAVVVVSE